MLIDLLITCNNLPFNRAFISIEFRFYLKIIIWPCTRYFIQLYIILFYNSIGLTLALLHFRSSNQKLPPTRNFFIELYIFNKLSPFTARAVPKMLLSNNMRWQTLHMRVCCDLNLNICMYTHIIHRVIWYENKNRREKRLMSNLIKICCGGGGCVCWLAACDDDSNSRHHSAIA